jgi:hypothetical protein
MIIGLSMTSFFILAMYDDDLPCGFGDVPIPTPVHEE